jgi:hypothetical protein
MVVEIAPPPLMRYLHWLRLDLEVFLFIIFGDKGI